MFQIAQDAAPRAPRQRLTIAHAHHVRRNPGVFDAETEAEAAAVIDAEARETYAARAAGDPSVCPCINGKPMPIAPKAPATAVKLPPMQYDFWFWIMAGLVGVGSIVAAHYVLDTALYLTRG